MPIVTLIDIDQPLNEIFERLGLDPNWVQHIDFWPKEARVTVYAPNEHGKKHVDLDTGEAAIETQTIELKRWERPDAR